MKFLCKDAFILESIHVVGQFKPMKGKALGLAEFSSYCLQTTLYRQTSFNQSKKNQNFVTVSSLLASHQAY